MKKLYCAILFGAMAALSACAKPPSASREPAVSVPAVPVGGETEETEETADAVKTESAGETGTGTDEDLTEVGTPAETKAAQPQTEKSRYQEPQTSSAAEVGKIVPQQGGEGAEDE